MMKDLVLRNRSCRRFREHVAVDEQTLRELVDLARLSASAANRQPLRYLLSTTLDCNELIFPCLRWAAYLKEWHGPEPGERPSAYIVMLSDTSVATESGWDAGIAAQTIMLGATERGLGGCILASVDKSALRTALAITDKYEIIFVLALGTPGETVVIEPVPADGSIRYWRGADGVHHVPKRSLEDIIIR